MEKVKLAWVKWRTEALLILGIDQWLERLAQRLKDPGRKY